MERIGLGGAVVLAVALSGCSVTTESFNDGTSAGGAVVGTLGTPPVDTSPVRPAMGAFLEGAVGTRLGDADRDKAYQAEVDALAAGDRKTWRGSKGAYGFVAPASDMTAEGCRGFTHTIYLAGRPQIGKGTGCKAPDGSWRVTS